mmetsp:Transcript_31625/g.78390  ORF Transcript_31625/g.78390 Transcript_31625/m.78390 type:complete len:328 (+) Transcript_31625:788-1771(+)
MDFSFYFICIHSQIVFRARLELYAALRGEGLRFNSTSMRCCGRVKMREGATDTEIGKSEESEASEESEERERHSLGRVSHFTSVVSVTPRPPAVLLPLSHHTSLRISSRSLDVAPPGEAPAVVAVPAGVLLQVLLMVLVRTVERGGVHHPRGHGLVREAGDLARRHQPLHLGLHRLRRLALLRVVHEHHRGVLRARVVALAVHGGGVVERVEVRAQILVRAQLAVVLHLAHLDVAGGAAAHLAVRGVGLGAGRAHEAHGGGGDGARLLLVEVLGVPLLGAPVAPRTEGRDSIGTHLLKLRLARVLHRPLPVCPGLRVAHISVTASVS